MPQRSFSVLQIKPNSGSVVLPRKFTPVERNCRTKRLVTFDVFAAKEPVPYAIERYTKEKDRLYGVLDQRLAAHEYLADEYSIADIATYPWVARYEWHKTNLADFPHVKRWFDAISARPAVQRGMKVPAV